MPDRRELTGFKFLSQPWTDSCIPSYTLRHQTRSKTPASRY